MLSDEDMLERMADGWRAGKPETVCGNGSLRINSRKARAWLPGLCERFDIHEVCDAGAGDLYFTSALTWDVYYRPFDLIPRTRNVTRLDITREALPTCDAILCRMVLNHLDEPRILMALDLFRQSGRYLIATQFNGEDLPKRSPQFTRLDLRKSPYGLGEPLESVQDGAEEICSLAIWRL